MKRRDVLQALAAGATGAGITGCTPHVPATRQPGHELLAEVLRQFAGVQLKPEELDAVQQALTKTRFSGQVAPTSQPSLAFDPEVDIE